MYVNNYACTTVSIFYFTNHLQISVTKKEIIVLPVLSFRFLFDDLQTFVNFPAKTTVGFAPKFTTNRKFFANLISTPAFKEILAKDEIELRKNLVKKMQFCDSAVMNQDLLQDMYDREVDQAKQ